MSFVQWLRESASGTVDLRLYNELQLQEIARHKWIESEKAGRDLGQEAMLDWIHRYAASFREALLASAAEDVPATESPRGGAADRHP